MHSRRISLRSLMECLGSRCPNLNRLCCQPGKPDWSQCKPTLLVTRMCTCSILCACAYFCISFKMSTIGDNICTCIPDPEESLKTKSCNQLIKGCPDLSYLALRGYGVADRRANILLKVRVCSIASACIVQVVCGLSCTSRWLL